MLPACARPVLVLLACAALAPGCCGVRERLDRLFERETVVDRAEGAARAADRLAAELAAAKTGRDARAPARAALAWSGLAVTTAGRQLVATPVAPAVPLRVLDRAADNLALDHVERRGYTVEQVGQMLAEFPEAAGDLAFLKDGQVLLSVMRESVRRARQKPQQPSSFVPLFVAASVKRRAGQDLASPRLRPADVQLTNLELLLFTAAHQRGVVKAKARPGRRASLRDLFVPPAAAGKGGPCAWIEETFGEDLGEFVKSGGQKAGEAGLDAAWESVLEKLEGMGKEGAAKAGQVAGKAISWVTALISAIGTYGGFSIKVEPDPQQTHMCHRSGDMANGELMYPYKKVHFVATVSSRPVLDPQLQKCLDFIDVELPDEDSAKKAIVRWSAGAGFDKLGEIDKEGLNGRLEQHVDGSGKARLQVTVKEEEKDAKKKGKLTKGPMVVKAELFARNPSGSKIATTIMTGGVPTVLGWWLDKWFPKSATGSMIVEYHTLKKVECHKTFTQGAMTYTLEAKPKDGLYGPWEGTLTGELSQFGITGKFDAKMSFTIVENGEGQLTGTHSYKSYYRNVALTTDLAIDGALTGTAAVDGSGDEMQLRLRVRGMNTKLQAKGRGIQGERVDYNKSGQDGGESTFVCALGEK
jgi:hypothetical protein